jgi:SAM-dependent methyltransferase
VSDALTHSSEDALIAYATGWKALAMKLFPRRVRDPIRTVLTRLAMLRSRMDPRARRTGLKLHLGCGGTSLPGWVNIDQLGNAQDFVWDLRVALPFKDGSADTIFSEHVLEHLAPKDAVAMLHECRRVLAPGGVLRVGVPDFRGMVELFLKDDADGLARILPERPTPMLMVNVGIYDFGHRAMWDRPTLEAVLREAGFADPELSRWGQSRIQPCPDSDHRRNDTLCMEVVG